MSYFEQPLQRELLAALSRPVPIVELSDDERGLIITRSDAVGTRIYENGRSGVQGRTLEGCILSARTGVTGEIAIKHRLSETLQVTLNDESETLEYHWDLRVSDLINSIKVEVKFQGFNVEGFSFASAKDFQTAFEQWRNWDLVIGWKLKGGLKDGVVIPYTAVRNEAFNPAHEYYQPSIKNDGTYLQWMKVIDAGLMKFIMRSR